MRKKLGECLTQAGLITEEQLQAALAEHQRTGDRLGAVLVRMGLASEKQIAKTLAHQLGFPYVSLTEQSPQPEAVLLIPREVAVKRVCIAVALEKNLLTVAMADPLLFTLVQDLEFQTGHRIKQVVATGSEILEAIETTYPDRALTRPAAGLPVQVTVSAASQASRTAALSGRSGSLGRLREEKAAADELGDGDDAAPIVDLVDLVIKSAVKSRASDVHVEPLEKCVLVRQRLDGLLKEVMDLPKWVHEGFVARVKVLAGLDIAEKRLPQDGRLRITMDEGSEIDFRVSTLRTLFGEKVVLRVLDHRKGAPSLKELGLSDANLGTFQQFLRHQHGMILVVGPTGSGKTTTLSSALTALRSERTNIVTIEDPIEYQLPGINQTQINEKIRLTFASALRSILRQDPDVILVGEIRDFDTAKTAMQAAQTGHLVLSTLHTDDAPSAVTRLGDIGLEPFVIGSALLGVVAQRLVRRLCLHCRERHTPGPEILRALKLSEADAAQVPFYRAVGCEECNQTGYLGRVAIHEVMLLNDKIRRLVTQRAPEETIREAAVAAGMLSLGEDGIRKVTDGTTTPEELLRVVTEVGELRSPCPGCGTPVGPDFLVCPQCARRLNGGCVSCQRALQPDWQFCPYCAVSTAERPARARFPRRRQQLSCATSNVTALRGA